MSRKDDPRIDRLVTGDLTPEERRALIGELESDPQGWQDLATAFLEAQCWRESFAKPPIAHRGHTWMRRGVAASLIAIAFGLGWSAHDVGRVEMAGEETTPAPPIEEALVRNEPNFERDDLPPPAPRRQPLTEYDLRRLERMGYQIGLRERFVSVPGEGGVTIAVPVREVEVRYVARPPT